jgi:hypothetical protein
MRDLNPEPRILRDDPRFARAITQVLRSAYFEARFLFNSALFSKI